MRSACTPYRGRAISPSPVFPLPQLSTLEVEIEDSDSDSDVESDVWDDEAYEYAVGGGYPAWGGVPMTRTEASRGRSRTVIPLAPSTAATQILPASKAVPEVTKPAGSKIIARGRAAHVLSPKAAISCRQDPHIGLLSSGSCESLALASIWEGNEDAEIPPQPLISFGFLLPNVAITSQAITDRRASVSTISSCPDLSMSSTSSIPSTAVTSTTTSSSLHIGAGRTSVSSNARARRIFFRDPRQLEAWHLAERRCRVRDVLHGVHAIGSKGPAVVRATQGLVLLHVSGKNCE